jgi:molybdopterin molybdotransferase
VISVDAARAIVLAHTTPLPAEEVDLGSALGRILREDVHCDVDMPPFDRSAMDGYALRADDAQQTPAVLRVVGQIRAGQLFERPVGPGDAVEIMTGAPVPPGATAVQQHEKTRALEGGRVEMLVPVAPLQNIVPRGSEVRAGDRVLTSGWSIDPAAVAVLAAAGRARVAVGPRPRLACLVTGDELVGVAEKPGPGRIRNSNGETLLAQARGAGADPVALGVAPDQSERIAALMEPGFAADVLVVSGGVSAGAFDLVEAVFARFGVEVFFDKVAVKPGAPLVFGRRGRTLVFGLPGNPVSAQVTFDLFVRSALLKLQGARALERPTLEAELVAAARNRSGRRAYLPARVRCQDGRIVAEPLRSQGSADVVAHARANALLVLEAERTSALAGERAPALLLGNFLERDGAA